SFEQALGWAIVQLRARRAKAMLVAGADEMTPLLARTLARGRIGPPLVEGEGAAAILVEREEDARANGRAPLAGIAAIASGTGSPGTQADAIASKLTLPSSVALLSDEDGTTRRARESDELASELAERGIAVARRLAVAEWTGRIASGG